MGIIWAIWGHMGPYGSIWGSIQVLHAVCGANFFCSAKNDTPRIFNCVFLLVFFMIWQFRDHMGLYRAIWIHMGIHTSYPCCVRHKLFFFGQKCHPKIQGFFFMIFFIVGQFRPALFEAFQNNYGQACRIGEVLLSITLTFSPGWKMDFWGEQKTKTKLFARLEDQVMDRSSYGQKPSWPREINKKQPRTIYWGPEAPPSPAEGGAYMVHGWIVHGWTVLGSMVLGWRVLGWQYVGDHISVLPSKCFCLGVTFFPSFGPNYKHFWGAFRLGSAFLLLVFRYEIICLLGVTTCVKKGGAGGGGQGVLTGQSIYNAMLGVNIQYRADHARKSDTPFFCLLLLLLLLLLFLLLFLRVSSAAIFEHPSTAHNRQITINYTIEYTIDSAAEMVPEIIAAHLATRDQPLNCAFVRFP